MIRPAAILKAIRSTTPPLVCPWPPRKYRTARNSFRSRKARGTSVAGSPGDPTDSSGKILGQLTTLWLSSWSWTLGTFDGSTLPRGRHKVLSETQTGQTLLEPLQSQQLVAFNAPSKQVSSHRALTDFRSVYHCRQNPTRYFQ